MPPTAFGKELIEDLLTLARRGDSVDPAPVDLAAVAEACWRTVETGDATLVVEADRSIRADESRLRQLLENPFRNSVEHGSTDSRRQSGDSVEHGPPSDDHLTVTLGPLDDGSGFYVADDGSGLPDDRSDVFEAGSTAESGGTGLGLAIVERIADEHGWSVTARNEGGARFEFAGVETV